MPTAAAASRSSITATLTQSLPAPSANAKANTNTPISSVRGSRQAASESRVAPAVLGAAPSSVGEEALHLERHPRRHRHADHEQVRR